MSAADVFEATRFMLPVIATACFRTAFRRCGQSNHPHDNSAESSRPPGRTRMSSPQKRGSSGVEHGERHWIPAFAGMTSREIGGSAAVVAEQLGLSTPSCWISPRGARTAGPEITTTGWLVRPPPKRPVDPTNRVVTVCRHAMTACARRIIHCTAASGPPLKASPSPGGSLRARDRHLTVAHQNRRDRTTSPSAGQATKAAAHVLRSRQRSTEAFMDPRVALRRL
jgi:hypothetical protein